MVNEIQESQWEYLLSPEFELSNSAGKPLTNGWIEVYIAGSRDKYYCASDFSGTLHPFQIPLDSLGSNIVLASPDNSYDIYVYNQYGSLIMSRYNVKCHGGGSGSSTYVGDRLYYGQFKATDVATQAGLTRVKGNIDVDDGKLELKQDMSYHITLRGEFVVNDVSNVDTVLSYIEYSAVKPININVDYTKDGSQYFEISYDIYRLAEDMDYPVSFLQSNGLVKNLVVEVHSLSNLATTASGAGSEYEPGWGIVIQNNVISVDPSILEDFTTTEEVMAIVSGITGVGPGEVYTAGDYISIEDNTISVTGIDPNNYVTYEFLDEAIASAVSGLDDGTIVISVGVIEAASDNTEVWDEIARIVDTNKYGVFVRHPNYENAVGLLWRGTRPETHDTLYHTLFLDYYGNGTATVRGEWIRGVTYRETRSDVNYLSEVHHDGTLTGSGTMDDQLKVNHQFVPYFEDLNNAVTAVSSVFHNELNSVSGILQQEIDNIDLSDYSTHTEVYNATVTAVQVATGAIPEMPEEEEVEFEEINLDDYALASAIPDVSDFVTHEELIEAVSAVTGMGEYGQFYCAACTGTAELGKVKGTLSVTNDGKVSLKAGCSYHVTVRGGVEVDPTANTYGAFGLIEFITGNSINSNIDRTIEDTQYFEISYDLYNLSADTDYEFAFTNVGGAVNGLYVEIHEIGHVGSGSGSFGPVTGTAEYDAGWGINIVNNVISVDPTVIPEQVQSDWAETASALPSFIKNKPVEYDLVAGQNISIAVTGTNVVISSTGGSGATYTEGFGIDISNNEIAIDPNVVALASAVNQDNILTYGVSTWNDFRTMLDYGTNGVFVKDSYGYTPDSGTYNLGILTYYGDTNAKFVRIDDTMTGTGNGRARVYTLTNSGTWSRSYVRLAPKVDNGFGISQSYNYANDTETLSVNTDVVALASAIPVIELNGDSQVTAIDGHALAVGGSGGSSYTAGTGIDITNDVISVDNTVAMKTDIPELPEEEEVEFEELNLGDYALASAIPTVQLDGDNQVTAIDGYALAGGSSADSDTFTAEVYVTSQQWGYSVDTSTSTPYADVLSAYGQGKKLMIKFNAYNGSAYEYRALLNLSAVTNNATHFNFCDRTSNTTILHVEYWGANDIMAYNSSAQADWNASLNGEAGYIKNKPSIPEIELNSDNQVTAIDGHTIAVDSGDSYTEGFGIDISNNEISIDPSIVALASADPNIFFAHVKSANGSYSSISECTPYADVKAAYDAGKIIYCVLHNPLDWIYAVLPLAASANHDSAQSSGYLSLIFTGYCPEIFKKVYTVTYDGMMKTVSLHSYDSQADWNQAYSNYPGYIKNKPSIPEIELNSDNQVTAIDGHTLAGGGGGGTTYTAGTGIDITNDVISVDNTVATKADVEAVSGLITPELPVVAGDGIGITETETEITIAVTGNYVSDSDLQTAIQTVEAEIPVVTGFATKSELQTVSASIPELPDEEEVEFEVIDLSDYALASAIPDTSDMATQTWVGNQGYLTSVPSNYVTETELTGAVSGFATKGELTTGLNGKQNTLTGITDVQVVQALPASPVATVLYLIPEV